VAKSSQRLGPGPCPKFSAAARCIGIFVLLLGLTRTSSAIDAPSAEGRAFFENKIRPVLVAHCYECHSAGAKELGGKLLLDTRAGLLGGGESGPALVAGKPDESLLIEAISRADEHRMPPEDPLPQMMVHDLIEWVKMGAPDPRSDNAQKSQPGDNGPESAQWSFQAISKPELPEVRDVAWPLDPLDHFVLARIEAASQSPSRDASPEKLFRRLYYDLIGLPPEIEEVAAFAAEHSRNQGKAVEALVDRLLSSPQFGERWGRHWLDVARYGESNGNDGLGRNPTFPNAWRYRDYVIQAFNDDVPYDRFLTEQIAGDLLPAETAEGRNRQLVATGFLAIGAKPAAAMNNNFAMDVVDDQINVVCTTVMGLSVSCARCHDHKHDPIPTRDYYAMAGIFKSTETLWGVAGNEKLTAPPTPLHELRSSLDVAKTQENGAPPKFADGYTAAIDKLKPALHARLDVDPDVFVLENGISVSRDGFAELKEGRMRADLPIPADNYSVAFWFRNDLGNSSRAITAYLFSHAADGDKQQMGDHIGLGGKHDPSMSGMLYVWNGQGGDEALGGTSVIAEKTWNHVVLVRDGRRIRLYLNGWTEPEIETEMAIVAPENRKIFVGARNDRFAPLTGGLAELVVFDRALSADEAKQLHSASGQAVKQPTSSTWAMGARDRSKVEDCKINIDGNSKKLGQAVPRGFLSAVQLKSDLPAFDSKSSGRLQLADWLTHADHPQTARVMVNRIWLHLFGQAIVSTPDDFGLYGSPPTHPQLLDHLATRFVDDAWSIKRMIRAIVLSRSYQLSSDVGDNSEIVRLDPDNHLLCRHQLRRLDAESLRDSILQATGELDLEPARGSAIARVDKLINWPPGEASHLHEPSNHRSIYLCMLRNSPPPELAAFDFPNGVKIAGKRDVTTTPLQVLFLLNNPFVVEKARMLAEKLLADGELSDDESRVRAACRRVLKREFTATELERSLHAIRDLETELSRLDAWAAICHAMLASNEFRYID
jgi:hypothetical protein